MRASNKPQGNVLINWEEEGTGLAGGRHWPLQVQGWLPTSLERGRESEQASSGFEPVREMSWDMPEGFCCLLTNLPLAAAGSLRKP